LPDEGLREQLLAFRDCDGRRFELDVGAFLNRHVEWTAWQRVEPDLVAFLEADFAGTEEAEAVERLRYAALYILAMRQRRLHQVDQFQKHMDSFEAKTRDSPTEQAARYRNSASYCHLKALLFGMKSGPDDLREALRLAERAHDKCRGGECEHSGIVHHLASLRAAMVEREPPTSGGDRRELDEMLALAERAIRLEGQKPYAKYLATRGRIRALRGEYDQAEADVKEAICNEGDSWDYPLRYADYRAILAQIALRRLREELQRAQATLEESRTRQIEMQAEFQRTQIWFEESRTGQVEMQKELKRAQDAIEESRIKQVELLGFFAGVRALVLTGMQMAQDSSDAPRGAGASAALLILLTGCLLAAFAGLGVLLHGKHLWHRPMAVGVLGVLLILGAVMFVLPFSG
jgi:tetratricopeptide (TPR) repeat protein